MRTPKFTSAEAFPALPTQFRIKSCQRWDPADFLWNSFRALGTLSPGRRHPFFSGGNHGGVSLEGIAV